MEDFKRIMITNLTVKRPAMHYYGGKWRLAPWVISHFPKHRIYVEPFGGAASVLLQKQQSEVEVYNDLNDALLVFFRVVRTRYDELLEKLFLTPYSRKEYQLSFIHCDEEIELARRVAVRGFMSHSSTALNSNTGWRCHVDGHNNPGRSFIDWKYNLKAISERLQGVMLESRDALDVIRNFDSPRSLIYCDPPYISDVINTSHNYEHQMSEDGHESLLNLLLKSSSMCLVSGYDNDLYRDVLKDWVIKKVAARAATNKKTTECLWMNKACVENSNTQGVLL